MSPPEAVPEHLVVAGAKGFRIRRKLPADFPDDYRWRCDPELARFDGRAPLEMTYEDFERQAAHDARYPSGGRESFSIDDGAGLHVGNCMYYNAGSGDSAELGMVIAMPEARDRGAGSALMVAFVRFLWQTRPFRVLVLHTLEWNERAIRSFRRAGFEESARVFRDGAWLLRMEARREWWLLWDAEGRFAPAEPAPGAAKSTIR